MHFANPYPTMNCMVLNERGQVLLVQRAHEPQAGSWCMPGGFIDAPAEGEPVESAQDAARRELMEEAGITASGWKCVNALPDWYNRERGVSTCNLCFVAVADPGQEPRCGSDAIDVGWFDQDDVAHRLAFDNQQRFYAEWLAEQTELQKQRELRAEIEAERFLNLDEQ
jgi:ADP-ribose pyrophosphatase YjhB (NUDIX family)